MKLIRSIPYLCSVAMLSMLGFGQAQATTYDISLLGTVSNGTTSTSDYPNYHFDNWYLSLSGLDSTNAITVSNGDTVNVTITLDQSFTIPASGSAPGNYTWFDLTLTGSSFPDVDTGVDGSVAFFNNSAAGPNGATSTTTHGQLVNAIVFYPPDNGPITFDSVSSSFTINNLASPATLDGANIDYYLATAVPEANTYAMMLAGLGLVGLQLRQRKVKKHVIHA